MTVIGKITARELARKQAQAAERRVSESFAKADHSNEDLATAFDMQTRAYQQLTKALERVRNQLDLTAKEPQSVQEVS